MVEGAPHTAKGSMINLCVLGCPLAPIYKGAMGEAGRPLGRARRGGVLLLVGVGLPFPSPTRMGKGRRRERRKGGAAPFLSPIWTIRGGGMRPTLAGPL